MERLSETVRGELARFGPQASLVSLAERWPTAVGAAVARNAWPARLGRDGTLHVNTADSVWAFELAQQSAAIARRLEVPAVRFAPGPLAAAPLEPARLPAPALTSEQRRRAAEAAAAIGDENLRKVVEKVVGASLARAAAPRLV